MQTDNAKRRRILYNRSLTVPDDYLSKTEVVSADDSDPDECARLLLDSRRESKGSVDSDNGAATTDSAADRNKIRPRSNSGSETTPPGNNETLAQKRTKFQLVRRNTVMCGEPLIERADINYSDCHQISRSISTPSVILNKVKEKIRRHVVQTTEWPPPSEMVREHFRRRSSLTSLSDFRMAKEARSKSGEETPTRVERIHLEEFIACSPSCDRNLAGRQYLLKTGRRRSPPCQECRSLSESQISSKRIHPREGGIVCSRDDIRAIMKDFKLETKRRKTPPKYVRATSMDGSAYCSVKRPQAVLRKQVSFDNTPRVNKIKQTPPNSPSLDGSVEQTFSDSPAVLPHKPENLYPEVFVGSGVDTRESKIKTFQTKTDKAYYDIRSSLVQDEDDQITAVKEITFDEHGQTWDVYGADFDAELLGEAIQKHLDRLISDSSSLAKTPPSETNNDQSFSMLSEPQHASSCVQRLGAKQKGKQLQSTIDLKRNGDSSSNNATKFFLRLFCLFGRKERK